jgi:hypothetical protein
MDEDKMIQTYRIAVNPKNALITPVELVFE